MDILTQPQSSNDGAFLASNSEGFIGWPAALFSAPQTRNCTWRKRMPSDRYTQAVFTVIAISLAVIAWKLPLIDVGHAQYACGNSTNPCYIATGLRSSVDIHVLNASEFSR
jgi:hypothetical protein